MKIQLIFVVVSYIFTKKTNKLRKQVGSTYYDTSENVDLKNYHGRAFFKNPRAIEGTVILLISRNTSPKLNIFT